MEARRAKGDCDCKIGRNAREYGLPGFDAELRRRHADGDSLRDLERFVNESILGHVLRESDVDVVGDVSAIYRTLSGDSASAGERTEVRERLSRAGVDVDALEDDFVTYQTVRSHLRECLGVDTGREGAVTVEEARGTIEWSRSRSKAIAERTLERLRASGELVAGDLEVSQVTRVTCADCGSTYPVDRFLDRGGCDCASDPDPGEE